MNYFQMCHLKVTGKIRNYFQMSCIQMAVFSENLKLKFEEWDSPSKNSVPDLSWGQMQEIHKIERPDLPV